MKKKIAYESFKSVYSLSSSVMSLKINRDGVLIAKTTIPMAILKRTRKLISNDLNYWASHTTIYSNAISASEASVLKSE